MPLYAFGSNGAGQLGVGHTDDLSLPARCLFARQDSDRHVKDQRQERVESDNDNGNGNGNQNDNGDDVDDDDDDKVVTVAAGGNHTLVLFSSGKVYAAGSNANGRCAHDAMTVQSLLRFGRVVVCDDGIDDDDDYARSDQAGESRSRSRSRDRTPVDRFSAVSATWEASYLVDAATSRLYVVGLGTKGELGLGQTTTETRGAVRMPNFPPAGTKIMHICSSGWHTVAVLCNGQVFGWGSARKGQLGKSGVESKIYWSPTNIGDVSFPVRQSACGREFTVLTGDASDGHVAILGSDKWRIQSAAPASLKGYSTVSASWHGVYVHNTDGSLVGWGRNDRGQLPPSDMPKPRDLAVGSEHVIAVIDSSNLVAFGWGEHGNCGPETDAQGNVAGRWADIPLDFAKGRTVATVGAGCATSWVVIK